MVVINAATAVRREHRHLTAASLGMPAVGHFGFFREAARERGWPIAVDWLAAGTA